MKRVPVLNSILAAVLFLLAFPGRPSQTSAQNAPGPDYRILDDHALAAPASVQTSFKSLASWLTAPCRSDEEKARAIFRWITQNIEYDVEALLAGGPMSGNAEDALRTRRGVCEGYAGLFMELAKASGIKAVKINGFAKGYGYSPGQQLGKVPNHAWNAVSIEGRWRLIDCTWGAGYIGNDRKFHRAFDPHFFFTPPREFIYDHFPEMEDWQLLDHPMSRGDYEKRVYVKPGFFTLGLTLGENSAGTLRADGELVVRLGITHPIAGVATLFKGIRSVSSPRPRATPECTPGFWITESSHRGH
jgi:transglutaminase/protease-like cytokinesis protein 3